MKKCSPTPCSSTAESHLDPLVFAGRLRVVVEPFLSSEWLCKHFAELLKNAEIAFKGGTDGTLDLVITGNHDRIDASHLPGCCLPAAGLSVDTRQPACLEFS